MSTTLHEAACSLNDALSHFYWFRTVGAGVVCRKECLIVYVSSKSKSVRQSIPESWEGYPVTYRQMSRPMPLLATNDFINES